MSKKHLQIAQNKAVRMVCNVDHDFSAIDVHTKTDIGWLDVSRAKRCSIEAYKALYALSPGRVRLNAPFLIHKPMRSLRQNNDPLFIQRLNRTAQGDKNMTTYCYTYWAKLPADVHQSVSLQFQTSLEWI